jgi:6-phosphogluconolactonase
MVEIIFNKDKAELNRIAVNIIINSIELLLEKQDHVILGIPGGRSVIGIFTLLKEQNIAWDKVHLFWVDERLVPLDDSSSNFKLANDLFIKHLNSIDKLPKGNVHPSGDAEKVIKKYTSELNKLGGAFDIVLLGSGEEGHVGGLFPYHTSIKDESEYFLIMHDSPKPPRDRMTSSKNLLLKSKVGILLFISEIKRGAYNNFKNNKLTIESCPAKLILSLKKSFVMTNLA